MDKNERELLIVDTLLIESIAGTIVSNERLIINLMNWTENKDGGMNEFIKNYRALNDEKVKQVQDLMNRVTPIIAKLSEED